MEQLQVQADKFKKELDKVPLLNQAEEQSGVPKLYLVGGLVGVTALCLIVGFMADVICNLAGFLYPAYASFKAIESEGKTDDVQWLTYWVVYACFSVLEVFSCCLTSWIPFYYAFKMAFLFWLFLPSTLGATFVYSKVLEPLLKANESNIDKALNHAKTHGGGLVSDGLGAVKDLGKQATKAAAEKLIDSKTE